MWDGSIRRKGEEGGDELHNPQQVLYKVGGGLFNKDMGEFHTCCVVSCCLVRETKVALAGIPGEDVGAST